MKDKSSANRRQTRRSSRPRSEQEDHRIEQPSVAKQRGTGSDVPGDVEMNPWNGSDRTDVTACVRGRTEFAEEASADASHKKFSDKKLPESRAKQKKGRA